MITDLPTKCIKRYRRDKHFQEFLPTRRRQKLTSIDIGQNYVTVTICISRAHRAHSSKLTRHSGVRQPDGTDRQTDGQTDTRQLNWAGELTTASNYSAPKSEPSLGEFSIQATNSACCWQQITAVTLLYDFDLRPEAYLGNPAVRRGYWVMKLLKVIEPQFVSFKGAGT